MVCPECGVEVKPGMRFCAECGTKLDIGQSTVSYAPSFGQEGEPAASGEVEEAALIELDQVEGTAGRRMHDLSDEVVTVGRGQESTIFLDDVTVSRRHAVLTERNGRFTIEDQGSLNGTFVNRERIDSAELEDGDEVQIGKYRLTFLGK